jgi:hypothetical protein
MKNIGISLIFLLLISSCNEPDINCETRGMKKVETAHGNICASLELKESDIKLILAKMSENIHDSILSIKLDDADEVSVFTSKVKKLNFNDGRLYMFKKTNNAWSARGVGEWIAD